MSRRAALIYNPTAGQRRRRDPLPEIERPLAAGGWRLERHPTTRAGHAIALAREAAAVGCAAVFAVGGAGTARAVATGLQGTGTALGVLPGRPTNVVARALGLPLDPAGAAARMARGEIRPVDVGRCGTEVFLMQASAGLDARVMAAAAGGSLKRRFGRLGIAPTALWEWWRYRVAPLELSADGERFSAAALFVCNLPLYAGSLGLLPQARWDDGRLDLLLLRGRRRRDALGFALALARGRHLRRADVVVRQVTEVRLEGPPGAAIQVDGDPLPSGPPVAIALAAEQLRVLLPALDAGA